MKAEHITQMRANPGRKPLTFGDFVADAYQTWGKRRAKVIIQLAIKSRTLEFCGIERVEIS
jgi:hypothetical protein